MPRVIVHTLLLFATLTSAVAKPPAPSRDLERIWTNNFTTPQPLGRIRVVDWNIDRGTNLDRIAAELEHEEPDLCFLQEVDSFTERTGGRNVSEELAKRLKLNYAFAPEFEELSQGSEERPAFQGDAILTRLPMRNVRVLRFKRQSGFWKPEPFLPNWPIFQRREGGRIALVAELQLPNGAMMAVYNAHLESRSFGAIQSEQLDEILADASHYPPGTALILAGDLNTKYDPHAFLKKLQHAGWVSAFGDRTPRTHVFVCALDWLVAHGPVHIESGMVLRGIGASDHFPISAELVATPPASSGE